MVPGAYFFVGKDSMLMLESIVIWKDLEGLSLKHIVFFGGFGVIFHDRVWWIFGPVEKGGSLGLVFR